MILKSFLHTFLSYIIDGNKIVATTPVDGGSGSNGKFNSSSFKYLNLLIRRYDCSAMVIAIEMHSAWEAEFLDETFCNLIHTEVHTKRLKSPINQSVGKQ